MINPEATRSDFWKSLNSKKKQRMRWNEFENSFANAQNFELSEDDDDCQIVFEGDGPENSVDLKFRTMQNSGRKTAAYLTQLFGIDINTKYKLMSSKVTMGRSFQADIRLKNPDASNTHCTLHCSTNGWIITDNISQNGVYINREVFCIRRLKPGGSRLLMPGDIIYLGIPSKETEAFLYDCGFTDEEDEKLTSGLQLIEIPPVKHFVEVKKKRQKRRKKIASKKKCLVGKSLEASKSQLNEVHTMTQTSQPSCMYALRSKNFGSNEVNNVSHTSHSFSVDALSSKKLRLDDSDSEYVINEVSSTGDDQDSSSLFDVEENNIVEPSCSNSDEARYIPMDAVDSLTLSDSELTQRIIFWTNKLKKIEEKSKRELLNYEAICKKNIARQQQLSEDSLSLSDEEENNIFQPSCSNSDEGRNIPMAAVHSKTICDSDLRQRVIFWTNQVKRIEKESKFKTLKNDEVVRKKNIARKQQLSQDSSSFFDVEENNIVEPSCSNSDEDRSIPMAAQDSQTISKSGLLKSTLAFWNDEIKRIKKESKIKVLRSFELACENALNQQLSENSLNLFDVEENNIVEPSCSNSDEARNIPMATEDSQTICDLDLRQRGIFCTNQVKRIEEESKFNLLKNYEVECEKNFALDEQLSEDSLNLFDVEKNDIVEPSCSNSDEARNISIAAEDSQTVLELDLLKSKLALLTDQMKRIEESKLNLLKNYEIVWEKNFALDRQLSEKKKIEEDLKTCEIKVEERVKNEILEHFEENLICNICTELFIKPTVLDCSHVFCLYCIKEWRKEKNECPMCRCQIVLMMPVLTLEHFIDKALSTLTPDQIERRDQLIKERENQEPDPVPEQPNIFERYSEYPVHVLLCALRMRNLLLGL